MLKLTGDGDERLRMNGEQIDALIVQGGTAFGGAFLGAGIAELGAGSGGPALGYPPVITRLRRPAQEQAPASEAINR